MIASVVAAVLAMGSAPDATLSPPRAITTASLDQGFGVSDPDQRFGVRLGFFGQLRTGWSREGGQMEYGASVPVARPIITAKLWGRRVRARLMPELAGPSPRLLDATATVEVHRAFAVQLGQYRPWLSRGYRTGLPRQALADRGPVVDEFRVGRDVGLTLLGRPWHGRFEYYLGVMNGKGPGSLEAGSLPLLTARVVVAPRGEVPYSQTPYLGSLDAVHVAMGASGYAVERDVSPSDEGPDVSHREYGGSTDVVVSSARTHAQLEGFLRVTSDDDGPQRSEAGLYGQLGVLVVRDRLDLAVRVGGIDDEGWSVPLEAAMGIYLAREHAKLQVAYGCVLAPDSGHCGSQSALAQAQLLF